MKRSFIVTIDADASITEMTAYIKDAVTYMGGRHSVDSPFFGLDESHVSVYPKQSKTSTKYESYRNTLKELCPSSLKA